MSAPDTSNAFADEAEHIDIEAERERLKAKLAALTPAPTEPEVIDHDDAGEEIIEPSSIEAEGHTWEFYPPSEGQIMSFSMGASNIKRSPQEGLRRIHGFLTNVLTEDSADDLFELMESRKGFTPEQMMNVISAIIDTVAPETANRAQRRAAARR